MHGTHVKLKDGREFTGPLWAWRPDLGFMEIVDEEGVNGGNPIQVRFDDVESATNFGIRVTVDRTEDVDLLTRARAEGWVPV